MIELKPFSLYDLGVMQIQDRHAGLVHTIQQRWTELEPRLVGPYSWTAWGTPKIPVAACGILECGGTWAFLAKNLRKDMIAVTREVRKVLDRFLAEKGVPYAEIDEAHAAAVRWVELLGFKRSATWRADLVTWHYRG